MNKMIEYNNKAYGMFNYLHDLCCIVTCMSWPCLPPPPGGKGGGLSPNLQLLGSAHEKNWTHSDVRFCENEGSK